MMFRKSITVPITLLFFSLVTILIAVVQAFQIPFGALPLDSSRLEAAPFSHFIHVVGGALFGLIGPLQFGRVLAGKYGRIHRVMGRVFLAAGAALSISSLTLLWSFPSSHSVLVSGGRLVFGIALAIALVFAMSAIKARNFKKHRDWMIRAYALGIGATAISMIFIPIYAITGKPPTGLFADIIFIGSWALCVALAEYIVRRLSN